MSEQVVTLSELLTSGPVRARGWSTPRLSGKAIVQGHCHHKAIMKMDAERRVLADMGLDVQVLEAGCCGMAGSFGYEKKKYDVSIAAGERSLLPEVRRAAQTTLVLADGFSCKSQIEQRTLRRGLHLAEVLKLAKDGWGGGPYPERRAGEARRIAQRRATARAGAFALVGAAAVGAALWLTLRKATRRRA